MRPWLLQYIEKADVKFIRSGKEYPPREGADHLRSKLGKAGGRVKTAEDFIEGIASKSYLNGDEYRVKFPDGKTRPTGPWLKEAHGLESPHLRAQARAWMETSHHNQWVSNQWARRRSNRLRFGASEESGSSPAACEPPGKWQCLPLASVTNQLELSLGHHPRR